MRDGRWVGAAVALAAVAALTSPAAATTTYTSERVVMTGANDVHEFATATVVPVENVRPYVPAQFRILGEQAGQAVVFVQIGGGQSWFVDGQPQGPARFGLVLVGIESPDGSPGLHRYVISFSSDNKRISRLLRRAGLPVQAHADVSVTESHDPLLIEGRAEVTARRAGSYGIAAEVAREPALPLWLLPRMDEGAVMWHQAGSKTVRMPFDITFESWRQGTAVVTASEGSMLAAMLGATSVETAAALIDGSVDWRIEVGTLSAAS